MKSLITLLLLIFPFAAGVCQPQVISIDDFRNIYFRKNGSFSASVKLAQITRFERSTNWSDINSGLQIPEGPTCELQENSVTVCTFSDDGLRIVYTDHSDAFRLMDLDITSGSHDFFFQGLSLKVGDDISRVAQRFPEAYEKRKAVPSSNGAVMHVLMHVEYITMSISFLYDPDTLKITEISVLSPAV